MIRPPGFPILRLGSLFTRECNCKPKVATIRQICYRPSLSSSLPGASALSPRRRSSLQASHRISTTGHQVRKSRRFSNERAPPSTLVGKVDTDAVSGVESSDFGNRESRVGKKGDGTLVSGKDGGEEAELPPDDSDEWVTIDQLPTEEEDDYIDQETELGDKTGDREEVEKCQSREPDSGDQDRGWRRRRKQERTTTGGEGDADADGDGFGPGLVSLQRGKKINKNKIPPRAKIPEDEIEERFLKGSGPGGQKINKTSSAVQLKHVPTGIVVKSQATRSRTQNRKIARQILADRLDVLAAGPAGRVGMKAALKRKRKADRAKKARRKYRALAEEEQQEEKAEEEVEARAREGMAKSET